MDAIFTPVLPPGAVDLLGKGMQNPKRTVSLISDLDQVSEATDSLQDKLVQVGQYVTKVVNGEIEGDPEIGRYLLDTISAVPKVGGAIILEDEMIHTLDCHA